MLLKLLLCISILITIGALTQSQAQLRSGSISILSSCSFPHNGHLQNLSLGSYVAAELQIWRPIGKGRYLRLWSAPGSSFADNSGIQVKKGDVVGWLADGMNKIELAHSEGIGRSRTQNSIYHVEEETVAISGVVSVCDGKMRVRKLKRSPVIKYKTQEMDGTEILPCFPWKPPGCINSHYQPPGNSRRVRRQTLSTQTTSTFDITHTLLPSPTNPSSTSSMESEDREGNQVTNGGGDSGSSGLLSPAALIVVIVSVVLLVLLVVLVFVLFACVFSKKTVRKTFIPANGEAQAGRDGIGASNSAEHSHSSNNSTTSPRPLSQQTTSTHAYINAEITQFGGVFRPFTPLYVNSDDESMREMMSDKGSHFGSRTRDGRGWSVVSSRSQIPHAHNVGNGHHSNHTSSHLSHHQLLHNSDQRERRAKSVSATSRFKVEPPPRGSLPRPNTYANNLSSILTKPLPPLPLDAAATPLLDNGHSTRSQPHLATPFNVPPPTHTPPPPIDTLASNFVGNKEQYLYPEVSGDYTSPVPVSERYKYEPNPKPRPLSGDVAEVNSVSQQPVCEDHCHDYSDPDEADEETSILQYDHLSDDIHPETASPATNLSGFNADKENTIPLSLGYSHGYVPTEEQRRMMLLHNGGHYEMADEIENSQVLGYDHLNYFRETDTYWTPATTAEDLYTQLSENKYREIFRHELSVLNSIGSGHFGSVSKGVWYNGRTHVDAAIKIMKGNDEQERVKLLQEAAIMGQFAHSNVVRLHGVVTVGEPVLVVLEYMEKGDLRSFLQKLHPRVSKRELPDVVPSLFVKFSKDISNGMSYLSKKCFIHRDLAARNILLNKDLTCKIGDFGMARDVENEGDYYRSHGGMIPVKWTAPEALHYNKYSSASDVWSYGMVLYEIWSLGEKPYSDFSNPIVIALVSSKHCQPPPPGCPRPVYHLMVECWNPEHSCRPTFDSIYDYFDSPDESLLQWPEETAAKESNTDKVPDTDSKTNGPQNLGKPLEMASDLYLDLQRTYQNPPPEYNH